MTHQAVSSANPAQARIAEIDMLRGLVIVLMALDHVRDYFHISGFATNPLDPAQTTPWLYTTRWITHLCAPTFVFLSGVSAYLQFARGKAVPNLSLFLLTRGLWLIFLELTVLSFGWSFAFPFLFFLQVIWAIGWSMIALAALVWLPRIAVLGVGIAIVAGHNLLDPISAEQFGQWGIVWTFLHDGGLLPNFQQPIALVAYPVLPWIGVAAFGYGMGAVFKQPPAQCERTLLTLGLAMLAAFFVLRGFNLYGNPTIPTGPDPTVRLWQDQPDLTSQIMVFFDVQKYPPSLHFVLVTLGVIFGLWPLLARLRGPVASVLNTFGAVPFFFYVLHIYLVHGLAMIANIARGRDASGYLNYLANAFSGSPLLENVHFPLWVVYIFWLIVLALLYPFCLYWQRLKARRRDWWLSYL